LGSGRRIQFVDRFHSGAASRSVSGKIQPSDIAMDNGHEVGDLTTVSRFARSHKSEKNDDRLEETS